MDELTRISQSKKTVYATIEFVDIAGLVKWASKGEGLGNAFLANIRDVDTIVQVLRHFKDSDVVHVEGNVDPIRDVEIINTELIMSDLDNIDKHLPNLAKRNKIANANKDDIRLVEILMEIKTALLEWKIAHNIKDKLSKDDYKLIKSYNFLTIKPIVYAINIGQDDLPFAHDIQQEYMLKLQAPVAVVCAKMEAEMMEFSPEDRKEYIETIVEKDQIHHVPTLDDLIALAFNKVGLMYYFTTGEKETKAWTIPLGSTAPQAAGAIHTDFERGFIKAEVVKYENLLKAWSRAKARESGSIKLEGKEYIVQDGDVMIFKFNV